MNHVIYNLPEDGWYAVSDLNLKQNESRKITLFGRHFIIVKNIKNEIDVYYDYCPHRGYPLSLGHQKEDQLVCSYHGWCFNKKGECTKVPGLEKTPRFKLESANFEIYDLRVWINLNKEAKFNMNFKRKVLDCQLAYKYSLDTPAYLLIENTLDPMHTPYIHAGLVRSETKEKKEVQISIRNNEDFVEAVYKNEGKQSGLISKLFSPSNVDGIGRFHYPGILELEFKSPSKTYMTFTAYLVPVNHEKVNVLLEINYSKLPFRVDIFILPLFKILIRKVIQQDIDVCLKQFENLKTLSDYQYQSTKVDYMIPYINAFLKKSPKPEGEKEIKILL